MGSEAYGGFIGAVLPRVRNKLTKRVKLTKRELVDVDRAAGKAPLGVGYRELGPLVIVTFCC